MPNEITISHGYEENTRITLTAPPVKKNCTCAPL